MMLKLMKYEIKSTYKVFFTIMASFVLLTILLCMSMRIPNTMMLILFSGACFVIGGGTFIAYLVTLLNRYYKNLYGREAYLMFTLPVKGWELVCSKFIIAMFWNVVLIVTVIICILAVTQFLLWNIPTPDIIGKNYTSYTVIGLIRRALEEEGYLVFCTFLSILVEIAVNIARVYFVISLAYLPCFKKGNIPIALFLYFVVNMIEGFVMGILLRVVFFTYSNFSPFFTSFAATLNILAEGQNSTVFFSTITVSIITIVLFLIGCSYILTKKVNIK